VIFLPYFKCFSHGFGSVATLAFESLENGEMRSSPKFLAMKGAGKELRKSCKGMGKRTRNLHFFHEKIVLVGGRDRNTMIFSTTSSLPVLAFVSKPLNRFLGLG